MSLDAFPRLRRRLASIGAAAIVVCWLLGLAYLVERAPARDADDVDPEDDASRFGEEIDRVLGGSIWDRRAWRGRA